MPTDARLDPVRWRGPRRVTVLRVVAVAALLSVAGLYAWAGTLPADSERPLGSSASGRPAGAASPGTSGFGRSAGAASPGSSSSGRPAHAASTDTSGSGRPAGAASPGTSGFGRPGASAQDRPGDDATTVAGDSAAHAGSDDGRPEIPPGYVGLPVRLADPTALTLVRPGDRVTLLRLDGDDAAKVADDVLILAVTGADDPLSGGLMVALKPTVAVRAASGADRGYALLLRPG